MEQGWAQIISFFLANAALIIWFRTESRNDWKHMDAKFDKVNEKFDKIHEEILNIKLNLK